MEQVKRIAKAVFIFLVIVLAVYFVFIYSLINFMMGIPALAIITIIFGMILLAMAWMFRSRKKIMKILIVCSILSSGIGITRKLVYKYEQSIPTVKDDDQIIFDSYQPFSEKWNDSYKGVKIDSTLKLKDNLPRLDGATALYPIYASIVQNVYPEGEYPYYIFDEDDEENLVVCTKTPTAYQRLIEGKTDIIFVAAPSQKQLEEAKKAGVEFEMTPIGKESFVFFVNSKNPVNDLTMEQIQKIYTGEITNWKQLGGENETIKAFQRPEGSGSQSALLRLMGDLKIMDPLEEDVASGMGAIIRQTANYRNFKNAIGYSFRFYSTELVKENKIKHLAINGVYPTRENILNNSYPITNDFYAITLKGHTNPNIDVFIDWIVNEQGQQIIDEIGYVSLKH